MKYCNKCDETKPLEDFWKRKASNDGLAAYCRLCWKYYQIERMYGLSRAQYDIMVEGQNAKCKVCQESKPLAVDHCHRTGKVRGLLCHECNRGIGLLGDSRERLFAAFTYLEESENERP